MSSTDEAAKQRIIKHMNEDHHDSVVRYAEHYAQVSRFGSRNATVKDVSLDKLIINAGGSTHDIPLKPPMSSWREARERFVEMDQESIAGLDRSKITIGEYRAPRSIYHVVIFGLCLGTYLLLSREANVLPGSVLYELVFKHFPAFAEFVLRVRLWVLIPMVVIHLGEAYVMNGRLELHSVPLFSRIWWLWMVSSFIEGVGSFQRIDAIVKEKTAKQAKH
ncbi:hypothetical protein EJ08DRAFT_631244 [Tothia fuscella]|uniref:DUF2470 domain-containing protein n=1 Tax=Tothia fuscella TaxID=1048955 RepID=A0A9P4NVF8_9PEZI|nr:hypothetical protein EJ08DRAFT_631244 [Tothia fuscella]